jgi:hypothetical protein
MVCLGLLIHVKEGKITKKKKKEERKNSFTHSFGYNHLKKGGFKFDLINVGGHVY